ncbi:hypothetical protein BU23DRAFT_520068 [Bimuria novae-zelandiae CBS 107.79]|uniref:Uncharacterized protein n=1 Tax=Bimuria novae-zelandiae CBS 107.79 TaxID=1447943 RepID=A0A6A5UL66_9PLEO|nr:hypothetical protein BU23DRAFT_520068 [Bimuria novae-zelandiae CBS 107.79]
MSTEKSLASAPSSLFTFLALYVTTLFSLDTWAAARASPYRAPSATNTYFRPATTPPAPGSYQAGMHGRGYAGPGDGGESRRAGEIGRVDARAPLRMGGSSGCGACAAL